MEAQARTHQLLVHNKELLDHIAALVGQLQGTGDSGARSAGVPTQAAAAAGLPPHVAIVPQVCTHHPPRTACLLCLAYSHTTELGSISTRLCDTRWKYADSLRVDFTVLGILFM